MAEWTPLWLAGICLSLLALGCPGYLRHLDTSDQPSNSCVFYYYYLSAPAGGCETDKTSSSMGEGVQNPQSKSGPLSWLPNHTGKANSFHFLFLKISLHPLASHLVWTPVHRINLYHTCSLYAYKCHGEQIGSWGWLWKPESIKTSGTHLAGIFTAHCLTKINLVSAIKSFSKKIKKGSTFSGELPQHSDN